jgi:hypothetical protein
MTADYKAMRKAAKMPERTVQVCMRGDLVAEFESLERELEQIDGADSLDSGAGALIERMEALQAEMRENTYPVKLRGMPAPAYRAFTAEHPARRDDDGEIVEDDKAFGINHDTFWPALIRVSIVDPELPTDADWDEFEAGLTDFQYGELANVAFTLNRSKVSVPFSLAASRMKASTGGE